MTAALPMVAASPAAATSAASTRATVGIPARAYAPYFETWTSRTVPAVAQASGSRYFTLAFLQTPKPGSCTLAWNGDPHQTVRPGGAFVGQVHRLQPRGGQVIVSLGGESADAAGTEIADSCPSVAKTAAAYEKVIATYGMTQLDMDVEGKSLFNRTGLARRSAAIRQLEDWAARTGRAVRVDLTVGIVPAGLPRSSRNVIA
ncbi:MAG: chitinase, partial [Actinomycetota bacterium]